MKIFWFQFLKHLPGHQFGKNVNSKTYVRPQDDTFMGKSAIMVLTCMISMSGTEPCATPINIDEWARDCTIKYGGKQVNSLTAHCYFHKEIWHYKKQAQNYRWLTNEILLLMGTMLLLKCTFSYSYQRLYFGLIRKLIFLCWRRKSPDLLTQNILFCQEC